MLLFADDVCMGKWEIVGEEFEADDVSLQSKTGAGRKLFVMFVKYSGVDV